LAIGGVININEPGRTIVGGIVIEVFFVTVIELLAVLFFASFAVAVIECVPSIALFEFHKKLYGAVVNDPIVIPSTDKVTDETPTLSLADTLTVTFPDTADPLIGLVIATLGAVISDVLVVPPLGLKSFIG
jgi:hypothetical protein